MLSFAELESRADAVARPIRDRLTSTGIGLLGTVRRDGSPRISPVEVSFQGDHLFVGMMPRSMKALDLRRDARFVLLTPVAYKDDLGGEGKLFGRAREVTDPDEVQDLLRPYPGEMHAHPVSSMVNNARNDGPELVGAA